MVDVCALSPHPFGRCLCFIPHPKTISQRSLLSLNGSFTCQSSQRSWLSPIFVAMAQPARPVSVSAPVTVPMQTMPQAPGAAPVMVSPYPGVTYRAPQGAPVVQQPVTYPAGYVPGAPIPQGRVIQAPIAQAPVVQSRVVRTSQAQVGMARVLQKSQVFGGQVLWRGFLDVQLFLGCCTSIFDHDPSIIFGKAK